MAVYRQVLVNSVNLKSTIRRIKTNDNSVSIYEQTKKGVSSFYTERKAE